MQLRKVHEHMQVRGIRNTSRSHTIGVGTGPDDAFQFQAPPVQLELPDPATFELDYEGGLDGDLLEKRQRMYLERQRNAQMRKSEQEQKQMSPSAAYEI